MPGDHLAAELPGKSTFNYVSCSEGYRCTPSTSISLQARTVPRAVKNSFFLIQTKPRKEWGKTGKIHTEKKHNPAAPPAGIRCRSPGGPDWARLHSPQPPQPRPPPSWHRLSTAPGGSRQPSWGGEAAHRRCRPAWAFLKFNFDLNNSSKSLSCFDPSWLPSTT